ncbi:MAG: hypothetical protein ACI4XK_04960 [Bacilli bacterium]
MRKSYKIILMIISILLIGSIIIGTSYSIWVKTAIQKEQNIVNSSCFDIEFTESSSINLIDAIPISDEAGLKKKPYTFTLKNTCNMNSKVTIALDVLSTSTMSSSAIKTSLTKGGLGGTPKLLTSLDKKAEVDISGAKEAYILGTDIIGANKSKSYSLYLWMDEAATIAEVSKSFSSKVVIVNTATEEDPPFVSQIADLATTNTTNFATDDPDNNIRYIGKNPNNYVYFNCSDYSNQSDSTCEKWRIIGVFKNVTKSDGTKEDLVKIVKDDSLGNISWDYKKNGVGTSTDDYGSNDWTDSQLMMMLNPTDYLKSGYIIDNNIVKDSNGQAIYQNMGSYYNGTSGCQPAAVASGTNFTCTSIDFTSTGLKNDTTRNAIESVVWNLGGTANHSSASNGLASHFYGYERGTTVYSGHAPTWTGKIGLMYPSDYGYATSGGSTTDRAACLAKEMYNWDGSDVSDCKNNNYLFKNSCHQWTLTPYSSCAYNVFLVSSAGYVGDYYAYYAYGVRPVAFLKSNISITNVGTGTSESPFQLKVG